MICELCLEPIPAHHRAWPVTRHDPKTRHFRAMRVCLRCLKPGQDPPRFQSPGITTKLAPVTPAAPVARGPSRGHGRPAHPKLTEDQVREVRALHAQGMNQVQLGERFGLNRQSIGYIVRRRWWRHVA